MRWVALLLVSSLALTGCAKYEFDIVEPQELAQHIGSDREQVAVVEREPIQYRMRAVEGRLVVHAVNTTDDPIELLGDKSYVVDPSGESRPLRSQTIAPHSFIRLILPPLRPMYQASPSWGFGIGAYGYDYPYYYPGYYWRRPYFYDSYYYDYYRPMYLTVYDENDTQYWRWRGESTALVKLVYRQGEKTFDHNFTFARRKM